MRPKTPVRVHMLDVITLLNDMEIMEALIDEETQVDMVLKTLSDSFDTFKLNYSMNNLSYNLTELMKELQVAEGLFGDKKNKKGEANLAVKKFPTYRTRVFKNKGSKKTPGNRPPPKPKADQSVDRCHHCNRMGHWKRNCPKYLNEIKDKKGKGNVLVTQACLVTDLINF